MSGLLITSLVLFACALLFAQVIVGWREGLKEILPMSTTTAEAHPMVSLIVPARDEGGNIAALLQDFYAQRYPRERMEVIVVDDGSTDGTARIVEGMMSGWPQVRLLKSEGDGKKNAITTGVRAASGVLIVLTDADVRCGEDRIGGVVAHWQREQSDMIVLPVITEGHGALGRLQEEEQAALLGMAMGSAARGTPLLAYGANLAFTREAFLAVGGYSGDRFASGDDLFLLDRIARSGRRVSCLFDAKVLVGTTASSSLGSFFQQRIRWAGKMRGAGFSTAAGGFVALAFPWILLWHTASHHLVDDMGENVLYSSALLAGAWACWLLPLISLVRRVHQRLLSPASIPIAVLSLVAFSCYAPIIALASLVVRPRWKGRTI